MAKKIPISFNNQELKDIELLIDRLGLSNTYGATPQVIKLSIDYLLKSLDMLNNSIPSLKPAKLRLLLASIERSKVEEYTAQELKKTIEQLEKV